MTDPTPEPVRDRFVVWTDPGDGRPVPAGLCLSERFEDGVGRCTFWYGGLYRRRPDAVAIDPDALPLPDPSDPSPRPRPITTDRPLFGVLDDAGPDGWGRWLMEGVSGRHDLRDAERVLATGPGRVGALAFSREVTPRPEPVRPWEAPDPGPHDLGALTEAANRMASTGVFDPADPSHLALVEVGACLGGARPKATVRLDGDPWIAKFDTDRDRLPQARLEHAAAMLARRCGVPFPETRVETVAAADVFLVRRFDRVVGEHGREVRLGFRSALTVLGEDEMTARYASYGDLAAAAGRMGGLPAVRDVWRRMAFNVMVSNDDDHLRNHGFVRAPDGRWSLSPAFDVAPRPSRSSTPSGHAVTIHDGSNAGTYDAVVGAGIAMGLPGDEVRARATAMAARVSDGWDRALAHAGIGAADRERLRVCVRVADGPSGAIPDAAPVSLPSP